MHIYNTQSSKVTLATIGSLNSIVASTKATLTNNKELFVPSDGTSFETLGLNHTPEINLNDDPWKYCINQYGYRGANWDFKKSPAVFGDSTVLGVGVSVPAAEILQGRYNDRVIPNLGIPAGSAVNIIKAFAAFAHLHPMSHAFITLPSIDRFYYATNKEWGVSLTNLFPTFHHKFVDDHTKDEFFKLWLAGPNITYTLDYIDWAQQIASAYDIKLFWTTWDSVQTAPLLKAAVGDKFFKYSKIDSTDSRDKRHPGIRSHTELANIYWNIIEQSQ
jgi:hypothetical protein